MLSCKQEQHQPPVSSMAKLPDVQPVPAKEQPIGNQSPSALPQQSPLQDDHQPKKRSRDSLNSDSPARKTPGKSSGNTPGRSLSMDPKRQRGSSKSPATKQRSLVTASGHAANSSQGFGSIVSGVMKVNPLSCSQNSCKVILLDEHITGLDSQWGVPPTTET